MSKKISLADIVALDNALDTMVFGKPLGLFGEKIAEKETKAEPKVEEKPNTIANIVALDKALDKAVFGKELGLFGEKATAEDIPTIAKVAEMIKNGSTDEERVARLSKKIATRNDCKPSIIGKRYKVFDNSYATCKTLNTEVGGLHGKVYEIVSEPYATKVKSGWREDEVDKIMVDVRSTDTGLVYSVLFEENGIMANDNMSYRDIVDATNRANRPSFL